MSDEEEDDIRVHVKKLLNEALERAEHSADPDPATLTEGVYASIDELDTPHHR
jgi:TPP-dependent pyruvate/acetoin dehydrogenase alpha subunit